MSEALGQVSANTIPAQPFMLTGQMTTADPTRSPQGPKRSGPTRTCRSTRAETPGQEVSAGTWDRRRLERFADRMQSRMEKAAPGFGSRVIARRVLGPREMEARDANLVGGAVNGGTANSISSWCSGRSRAWSRRDAHRGSLPRLRLGAPRRRSSRRPRHERRTGRRCPRTPSPSTASPSTLTDARSPSPNVPGRRLERLAGANHRRLSTSPHGASSGLQFWPVRSRLFVSSVVATLRPGGRDGPPHSHHHAGPDSMKTRGASWT